MWSNLLLGLLVLVTSNCFELKDCPANPKNLKPPTLTMKGRNTDHLYFENDTTVIFGVNQEASVSIFCSASYPIEAITGSERTIEKEYRKFDDFHNESTFTFHLEGQVQFYCSKHEPCTVEWVKNNSQDATVRCQALGNPCLHQTIRPSVNEYNLAVIFSVTQNTQPTVPTELKFDPSPVPPARECEATFYYEFLQGEKTGEYYKRITKKPRYNVRCKFTDGTPGNVTTHYCSKSTHNCYHVKYSHKLQTKNCWKPLTSNEMCVDCLPNEMAAGASISFCSRPGPDGMEIVTLGSFAISSVPKYGQENQWRELQFDNKNIRPETMVQIQPFGNDYNQSDRVEIKCRHSSYYNFKNKHLIGLEYEGSDKIELVESTKDSEGESFFEGPEDSYYLYLNNPKLIRIYCIGAAQRNFGWVNASTPIRVKDLRPRITFDEKPSTLPMNGDDKYIQRFYESYDFPLGQTCKKKIYCRAIGNPAPKINWTSPDCKPLKQSDGSDHHSKDTWSELTLTDESISGTYKCTAENYRGKISKDIHVNFVQGPVGTKTTETKVNENLERKYEIIKSTLSQLLIRLNQIDKSGTRNK